MKTDYSFARNRWTQDHFMKVRSPRWKETSHWEQLDDCIANDIPPDLKPEDMQMGRDRTGETYISMLLKHPVTGPSKVETHCAFDSRMAPLIVFSRELTPIHKDHLEVVLYDSGVNLWHHYFEDGKPSWKLLGCLDLNLERGKIYSLGAQFIFNKKGIFLIINCDDRSAGFRIDDWVETYYVGFTACEGRNRFYDFSLNDDPELSPVMRERFTD